MNPLVWILLQTAAQQAGQRRIEFTAGLRNLEGVVVQNCVQAFTGRSASKRPLTGEHFKKDRAQIEKVAAVVCDPSPELLGRHIARRPENTPGSVLIRTGCRGISLPRGFRLCELGQTEVENLNPAVASYKQVLGLEVPMGNPLVMSGGKAIRDLARVLEGLTPG